MNYSDGREGQHMGQSDILNDVFDFGTGDKHEEFLVWAGEALGVVFAYDSDTNDYVCLEVVWKYPTKKEEVS